MVRSLHRGHRRLRSPGGRRSAPRSRRSRDLVGRLSIAALLIGGCSDDRPAPRIQAITPASGWDDEETAVAIEGRFIAAVPEIEGDEVKRVRSLSVTLGGTALSTAIAGRNTLSAVVPAGMRPGWLVLEMTDPFEQRARVEEAFCVLGPPARVRAIAIEIGSPAQPQQGEPIPVRLTARDAEGRVVERFAGRAVLGGGFSGSAGPFDRGAWSGEIQTSASGSVPLTATVDLEGDPAAGCVEAAGSGAVTIDVAAVRATSSIDFVSPQQEVTAGRCSGEVIVERRDQELRPFAPPESAALALSSVASLAFYSDASCSAAIQSIEIPPDGSRASFYFIAREAAPTPLRASIDDLGLEATQVALVQPAPPFALRFLTPPQAIQQGTCSAPVLVGVVDEFGNPALSTSTIAIDASENGEGDTYEDAGCGTATRAFLLAPGRASVAFHFLSSVPELMTIIVSAAGLEPDEQIETIAADPPPSLVFGSAAINTLVGVCSGPIAIEAADAMGGRIAFPADTVVSLEADPPAGVEFHSSATCLGIAISSVEITAGSTSADFWFLTDRAGDLDVTISAPGFGSATQTQMVLAIPTQLRFVSPPRTIALGRCSESVVVEVQDANGNLSPVAAPTSVTLSPVMAPFFETFTDAACTTAQSVFAIPSGEARILFYFTVEGGTGSIDATASAMNLSSATQRQTITQGCASGFIDANEECDDGNVTNGDGCGFTCAREGGYVCLREPSICLLANQTAVVDASVCPSPGAGSEADPFCRITSAVGFLPNIMIRPGDYDENISLASDALVVADRAFLTSASPFGTVNVIGTAQVRIIGLSIASGAAGAVSVADTASLSLAEVRAGPAVTYGVRAINDGRLNMDRCTIQGAADGIVLDTTRDYIITNSLVVQNDGSGIVLLREPAIAPLLTHLTIADNNAAGIECAAPGTVRNSIFSGNGIDFSGSCSVLDSSLATDPIFSPDGSYHLLTTSSCIGAASILFSADHDFDGEPRGAFPDQGADEVP